MSAKLQCGPAFPNGPGSPIATNGMSLRDYFAGHAPAMWERYIDDLPGALGESHAAWMARRHAIWSYAYADAMLAERAK